jgi:hypothetical protein
MPSKMTNDEQEATPRDLFRGGSLLPVLVDAQPLDL